MSTTLIMTRQAAEAIRLEELRRQQAEQAERERQRAGIANEEISRLDRLYREQVGQLDHAAARLPDLAFQPPALPAVPQQAQGASALEHHASQIKKIVLAFQRELPMAVRQAEAVLADRKARAEAWREATALQEAVQAVHRNHAAACQTLHETAPALHLPRRPNDDASLASLQRYVADLTAQVAAIEKQTTVARRRIETRRIGASLAGAPISASSTAESALAARARKQREEARLALSTTLAEALRQNGFGALSDLPYGTQTLLNAALDASEASATQKERIHRIVARERVLQENVTRAEHITLNPPEQVHAYPGLAQRWTTLLQAVQDVRAGHAPMLPLYEQEYHQLCADAQREISRSFLEADWKSVLGKQGIDVVRGDHGQLVLVDLNNLDRWLPLTEIEQPDGASGIAFAGEVTTDAPEGEHQKIADEFCRAMRAASQTESPKVAVTQQVVETKRLKRSHPPTALKHMRAHL